MPINASPIVDIFSDNLSTSTSLGGSSDEPVSGGGVSEPGSDGSLLRPSKYLRESLMTEGSRLEGSVLGSGPFSLSNKSPI